MTAPSMTLVSATAPATLTPEQALASAARLRPQIIEEAAATEARTFHSPELHLEFARNGFYNMLRPKRYGGYEFSIRDAMRVIREIGRGDMATGWCLSLATGHNLQAASWFPESVQDEIFGSGDYFAAASTSAPGGKFERVEGGFRYSGTHKYSSGVPYSTHFIGVGLHSDIPGRASTFMVPRSEFSIADDWGDTLGLRGSGSHSVILEDVFIPAEWVLEGNVIPDLQIVRDGSPGLALHGNPMYFGRNMGFFALELTSAAVGGIRGALDEYAALMTTRRIAMPPFALRSEDPHYLGWYASAAVRMELAESALDRAADLIAEHDACAAVDGAGAFEVKDDLFINLLVREGLELAWNVLQDTIMRTAGSSAAVSGSRVERIFRDATMAWGHFNTIAAAWTGEYYARAVFGTEGAAPSQT